MWLHSHAWNGGEPWGTRLGLGRLKSPKTGTGMVVGAASRLAGVGMRAVSRTGRATMRLTGGRESESRRLVRAAQRLGATGGSRLLIPRRPSLGGWGKRGRHLSATSNAQETVFADTSQRRTAPLATPTKVEVGRRSSEVGGHDTVVVDRRGKARCRNEGRFTAYHLLGCHFEVGHVRAHVG